MGTWLLKTSLVVAPMRVATKRWSSGCDENPQIGLWNVIRVVPRKESPLLADGRATRKLDGLKKTRTGDQGLLTTDLPD